jgi:hypothetical protein
MQFWPCTAQRLLALIQTLTDKPNRIQTGTIELSPRSVVYHADVFIDRLGNTQLMIRLLDNQLQLQVSGFKCDIADIVEQLAWLGCALQPHTRNFTDFLPKLGNEKRTDLHLTYTRRQYFARWYDPREDYISRCWLQLFDTVAIAQGFPISSRAHGTLGLEIPLGIAAALIGAEKVVPFKSRLLIKGFSFLLFPTKVDREHGVITWHLIKNKDGTRISYADSRIDSGVPEDVLQLQYADLENARHVIGWCPTMMHVAGR